MTSERRKREFKPPKVTRVKLVPKEAVLAVCKTAESCIYWPAWEGAFPICWELGS